MTIREDPNTRSDEQASPPYERLLVEIDESAERHRLLAEHASDVIWSMSVDGKITFVSDAVEKMRGFTAEEAMLQSIDQIHPPESMAISLGYFERLYERLAEGLPPEEFRGELEYFCKDGPTVWCDVQVFPHLDAGGNLIEVIGVSRDANERKRREDELRSARDRAAKAVEALREANEELARMATIDSLTGASNRGYFEKTTLAEMARAARSGEPLTVVMVDIDLFKSVNDLNGHLAGDGVLVEVVRRVRGCLRSSDVLARWGGEEFIIVLPDCTAPQAVLLAERLRGEVATPQFPGIGRVTASFGVAQYRAGESMHALVSRVDAAVYEAKAAGRNAVRLARD